MKPMEMGGREEILLEIIFTTLIIRGILSESDSHKLDQPISEEDYRI
jgi:hypothetical protein